MFDNLWAVVPSVLVLFAYSFVPKNRKLSLPYYAIPAVILWGINIYANGILFAVGSLFLSMILFIVFLYARLLARNTLFAIATVGVGLSILQWWIFLPGLVIAGIVSAIRLRKTAGKGYVTMLANETMFSTGVNGGLLAKPDLSRVPLPDTSEEIQTKNTPIAKAQQIKLPLLKYVSYGAIVSVALVGISKLVFV